MAWRSGVCGLLLIAAACGHDAAPAPAPSADPAGTVVALDGSASAVRAAPGATARQLAVKADVFADDTITTAPQTSLKILLTHNQVTWSLEGGQERRVDQSLAWKAAPGSTSPDLLAANGDEHTAAAGRHTENEAMGTVATVAPVNEEAKPDDTKAQPPPPPPPPKTATKKSEPPPRAVPPPPPPPPPEVQPVMPAVEREAPPTAAKAQQYRKRSFPTAHLAKTDVGATGLSIDSVSAVGRAHLAEVQHCFENDPLLSDSDVVLKIAIAAGGNVVQASMESGSAMKMIGGCISDLARTWTFDAGAKAGTLHLRYEIRSTP